METLCRKNDKTIWFKNYKTNQLSCFCDSGNKSLKNKKAYQNSHLSKNNSIKIHNEISKIVNKGFEIQTKNKYYNDKKQNNFLIYITTKNSPKQVFLKKNKLTRLEREKMMIKNIFKRNYSSEHYNKRKAAFEIKGRILKTSNNYNLKETNLQNIKKWKREIHQDKLCKTTSFWNKNKNSSNSFTENYLIHWTKRKNDDRYFNFDYKSEIFNQNNDQPNNIFIKWRNKIFSKCSISKSLTGSRTSIKDKDSNYDNHLLGNINEISAWE